MVLPQLAGRPMVTDGGLETDLIFHHRLDLPEFAAFPLVESPNGPALLAGYYADYVAIARAAGSGLLLESATWRANPDWGARVGYSKVDLHRVNRAAIEQLQRTRDAVGLDDVVVVGTIGPRGDGYRPGPGVDPDEAAEYHRPQLDAFAAAGADLSAAYTLTDPGEAIGIVTAARAAGITVAISFTVETDGRLPGGVSLRTAIETVDAAAAPEYFVVNCAHPTHVLAGMEDGDWRERVVGLRCNASRLSHAELDEADELDEGEPADFASAHAELRTAFPNLTILGGCCGTDARHVAALWQVPWPPPANARHP